MQGYSRVIEFEGVCGTPMAVELPAPPRGQLERVILTQVGGDAEEATCNIYDRKGACVSAHDLNVRYSGSVSTIADDGAGFLQLTMADPHNLISGDRIELKGCSESSYNTIQVVTAVLSDTEVVTDKAYISPELGPFLWQTAPFDPTMAQITHLVYTFNKVAGTDFTTFDLNRAYENKDNRDLNMRCRTSALWLEVLTVGSPESLKFQIAYTCRGDTIV